MTSAIAIRMVGDMETINAWTTIDKSTWATGPWQTEADKYSWTDDDTGMPCLIVRNRGGALCGYVGVGPDHPWHGVGYSEHIGEPCGADWCYEHTPEGVVEVHGGLTFADKCQHSEDPAVGICHVPQPGEPDNVWWFGFDCAHYMDLSPAYSAQGGVFSPMPDESYRDVSYVKSEIRSLARQLTAVA